MTGAPAIAVQADTTIRLDVLALDPRAHVRPAIDSGVVTVYAERMAAGDVFPPIVVYRDGLTYRLADGWHRVHAARQLGETSIRADVRVGSERDALWYGLGAQRQHGYRLTDADVRRAVMLAITAWPDVSGRAIADQVGCAKSYVDSVRRDLRRVDTTGHPASPVIGRDGKQYSSSPEAQAEKRRRAAECFAIGMSVADVCQQLHMGRAQASAVRQALGLAHGECAPPTPPGALPFKSRAAVEARVERMRKLADDGHTSQQIADALGVSLNGCRVRLRQLGIVVRADAVTHHSRRLDATRIVESMVEQAEHLCADTNLIDFRKLPAAKLLPWVTALQRARRDLARFIRQLQEHTP